MNLATAFVEVRADTKPARKDIDDLGGEMEKLPGRARSVTSQLAQLFGAAAFTAGIKRSIDAASGLQQAIGATETVFGSARSAVDQFAESSAEGFGISERAARELTAGIGALLENMGLTASEAAATSVSLAKVGADLAAAFGGKPEEAVQALGDALRGETDPVERFGISLSQARIEAKAFELGLVSSKSEIDQHVKLQATLALITEQTAAVQGQAAREADTAAGQQARAAAKAEDAAASLGQIFLPVYSKIVKVVGVAAKGFGELPEPIQLGVVALAGFAALAGPIRGMVGNVADLGRGIANMIGNAGNGSRALGALTSAATIAGAALAGAAAAAAGFEILDTITGRNGDTTAALQQLTVAISNTEDATLATSAGALALAKDLGTMANAVKDKRSTFSELTTTLGTLFDDGKYGAIGMRDAFDQLLKSSPDQALKLAQALQTVTDAAYLGDPAAKAFADNWGINEGTADKFYASAYNAVEAQKALATATTEAATAADTQATSNDAVTKGAPPLLDTYGKLTDAQNRQGEAARAGTAESQAWADQQEIAANKAKAHQDAVKHLTDSLDDERTIFDELAAASSRLKAALDAVMGGSRSMEEANRAAQAASDDLATAYDKVGKKGQDLKDVNARVAAGLDITTEAGRANREQIQKSVDSIIAYGVAAVGAGASNTEAAGSMNFLTEQLKTQLEQYGFTKDQIDEYLTTLGLTPDQVTTTLELAGNEAAKAELEARQADLDKLSAGALAEIQTDVDDGDYQAALAKLNLLTAPRSVLISTKVSGVGKGGVGGVEASQSARGRFVPAGTNLLSTIAEPGAGDEAVLPLQQRSRLQELLSDPRIGEPIVDALGATGGGGNTYIGIGTLQTPSAPTVDDISQAMALARLRG